MISSVLKAGRAEAISRKSYVIMQSAYEVQHSGADDDRRNVGKCTIVTLIAHLCMLTRRHVRGRRVRTANEVFEFVRLLNRDRHCGQSTASVRAWTDVTHESLSFLHFTSVT